MLKDLDLFDIIMIVLAVVHLILGSATIAMIILLYLGIRDNNKKLEKILDKIDSKD